VGIVALAAAFHRACPGIAVERYLVWVVLFPSLWYWPAAVGKDALILAGIGLATLGYVGRNARVSWLPLLCGFSLLFAVRPQVAALLTFTMAGAHAVSLVKQWTLPRLAQACILAAACFAAVVFASKALGVPLTSLDAVEVYLDRGATVSGFGGSAIEAGGATLAGMLLAPVNVLLRPFPWEARGVAGALAAVEILALWGLVFVFRRNARAFVRQYRSGRLFWLSVFFIVAYVLLAGMALSNIGLIARQRVHVFPFLFIFLTGQVVRHRTARPLVAGRGTPAHMPAMLR
jgi:hypothetical protein